MRSRLAGLLIAALAAGGAEGAEMPTASAEGARDFDFLMGAWTIHNRRLRERLKGATSWDEFAATSVVRPVLGGTGNEDVYRTEFAGGFTGMSFRFFDPKTRRWSIYWADSRRGTLDPPVVGAFHGDTGVFEGDDTFEGRRIRVRFTWSRADRQAPRWEQAFSEDGGKTWETNWVMEFARQGATAGEYPVVELRRYDLAPGQREAFARVFDSYFPEAFQELGAIVFGQFRERANESRFTWLRGYPSYEARAEIAGQFYSSGLWKEHAARVNDRLLDSGNVLLLRPLVSGRGLKVEPAVDVGTKEDEGRTGVVVLQIFPARSGAVETLAGRVEETFAAYRRAGAQEAGVLVTLDRPNNFPRHPVRDDGPFLVWVGVAKDDAMLETRLLPLVDRLTRSLRAEDALRDAPELVVLDPTRRSRLRWRSE